MGLNLEGFHLFSRVKASRAGMQRPLEVAQKPHTAIGGEAHSSASLLLLPFADQQLAPALCR